MNLTKLKIQEQIQLCNYSTLGVGGEAKYFVEVKSVDEMLMALEFANSRGIEFIVIGKGSNTLFDDRGYCGLVIYNKIDFFEELKDGVFHVGAGYSFSLLGSQTARKGWAGLEFASGIPGSVGGAVYMNAGANGSETCDPLYAVDYIDESGELRVLPRDQLEFSYRSSPFQNMKGAIVGAEFHLSPCSEARKHQIQIIGYRTKTQPYGAKSAGCIFRNPPQEHAGALIEKTGLKGYAIGGAKVSDLHANFIVNADGATSQDILKLIDHIKTHIYEKSGFNLESEVRYIPYQEGE
ncbi:MAG: UDP-N-acetylmuramate dehydrogenase [Chlamydiota bacterium]|nr:UDP-N-acetylmuramate dehydrogenase [Chlamydiota bacterium]